MFIYLLCWMTLPTLDYWHHSVKCIVGWCGQVKCRIRYRYIRLTTSTHSAIQQCPWSWSSELKHTTWYTIFQLGLAWPGFNLLRSSGSQLTTEALFAAKLDHLNVWQSFLIGWCISYSVPQICILQRDEAFLEEQFLRLSDGNSKALYMGHTWSPGVCCSTSSLWILFPTHSTHSTREKKRCWMNWAVFFPGIGISWQPVWKDFFGMWI